MFFPFHVGYITLISILTLSVKELETMRTERKALKHDLAASQLEVQRAAAAGTRIAEQHKTIKRDLERAQLLLENEKAAKVKSETEVRFEFVSTQLLLCAFFSLFSAKKILIVSYIIDFSLP
jgi:hypothetical protein